VKVIPEVGSKGGKINNKLGVTKRDKLLKMHRKLICSILAIKCSQTLMKTNSSLSRFPAAWLVRSFVN